MKPIFWGGSADKSHSLSPKNILHLCFKTYQILSHIYSYFWMYLITLLNYSWGTVKNNKKESTGLPRWRSG